MLNMIMNTSLKKIVFILTIVFVCAFLCFFSKEIRKTVSTIIMSTIIPFILVLIQKFGLGLSGLYTSIEKSFYNSFDNVNKLQLLISSRRDLIILLVSTKIELSLLQIYSYTDIFTNIKLFFISSLTNMKNIELKIKNEYIKIEKNIIKRINMSKLSINFRV